MNAIPTEILELVRHKRIPEWALWLAQDSDGSWWAYQAEPLQNNRGWYENEIGVYRKLLDGIVPADWTEQLYKIESIRDQIR